MINYLASDFAISRFMSLWHFDLDGASSVSIRARDILRLVNFFSLSGEADGSVGVVKAAIHAPLGVLALIMLVICYCNLSSALLVFSGLIFLPVTHPFIWVVLSFHRYKRGLA